MLVRLRIRMRVLLVLALALARALALALSSLQAVVSVTFHTDCYFRCVLASKKQALLERGLLEVS